jgi:branched-subunit amino acid transport protein
VSTVEGVIAILGMALLTLVTRGFFLFPERELPLPAWLQQGLRYAPLAALVAVIAPEIVMTQGQLITTLRDPRLPAVAVATAYFYWRHDILGTILTGTATLLLLKLAFGW